MKIIVPMAGRGSRLRPHTLTVPKPLVPVAGMPIVHRLVRDITAILDQPIEEVAFVIGDPAFFGPDVEESLLALAKSLGAKGTIYRQDKPLGTGHAIMAAEPSLEGPAVIAYADTLIRASFSLDPEADSVIWTKKVDNPEAYGVVKLDADEHIVELVEKPQEFISDQAVIGIYYFKEVSQLRDELRYVLERQIINGGEYQINDGIKRMMAAGKIFKTGTVDHWMDCGNKKITVETNAKMLGFLQDEGQKLVADDLVLENAKVVPPCAIAAGVRLKNTTVGPFVSIGSDTTITDSNVKNSIIQSQTTIKNATLEEAMIGNQVYFDGQFKAVSLGDYSELK